MQQGDWGQWLLCDGRAVDKSVYRDLLIVLDYQFGVDSNGNPLLPDLRTQFIRGASDGRAVGSLQDHALQSHEHALAAKNVTPGTTMPSFSATVLNYGTTSTGAVRRRLRANSDTETRPKNIALNAFISSSHQDSLRKLAYELDTPDMGSL